MGQETDVEELKKLSGESTKIESDDVMERIIQEVGEMGRYQQLLFVGMLPFFLFFVFAYTSQMFIAATPQHHWCRIPELQHLDVDLRRNLSIPGAADGPDWDRCRYYDANWTHVLETMAVPTNSTSVPCQHGWEFLYDDIPYATVVSEREWVCDRAGIAPIAQSTFFVGSLVGCALFGWMGDRFGRLPTLIAANLVGCVGGVLTVFTRGAWDFILARFIVGLCNDCCVMMIYIIVIEYVGPRHRTWVSNMSMALYCSAGALAAAGAALVLRDWRRLTLATSLPMLLAAAAPYCVPESARWLASKGKVNEAVKMLRRFERINKTKISEESMNEFILTAKQSENSQESMTELIKNGPLRTVTAALILVGMIINLALDAIIRMSENIGSNFFVTFSISSISEIPALILVTIFLDRLGRRPVIAGTLVLSGAMSALCAFAGHGALQVCLAVGARVFSNMAIGAHFQLASEVVPTRMRAAGNALVHLAGYVAITASPYVVYSGHLWSPLPLLILAVLCLIAAALSLLLPETTGKPIPQTVADAENIIYEGSLWRRPAIKDLGLPTSLELTSVRERNKSLDTERKQ